MVTPGVEPNLRSTRLRSDRDDNSVPDPTSVPLRLFRPLQNCRLDQVTSLRQVEDGMNAAPRLYPVDRSKGGPHISLVFGETWDTATVS